MALVIGLFFLSQCRYNIIILRSSYKKIDSTGEIVKLNVVELIYLNWFLYVLN